jgi:hypothetical protein
MSLGRAIKTTAKAELSLFQPSHDKSLVMKSADAIGGLKVNETLDVRAGIAHR